MVKGQLHGMHSGGGLLIYKTVCNFTVRETFYMFEGKFWSLCTPVHECKTNMKTFLNVFQEKKSRNSADPW